MLYRLLKRLHQHLHFSTAEAHCDIPCGIYDPMTAQLSTLSVLRFMDLISELQQKESLSLNEQAQLVRLVNEKEAHADKVKDGVRIIWGDFIKQPQIDKRPDTHELTHNIMLAASACKQNIGRDKGEHLLALVNQFAEYFWQAKGLKTYRATCPYPPAEELVYPELKTN